MQVAMQPVWGRREAAVHAPLNSIRARTACALLTAALCLLATAPVAAQSLVPGIRIELPSVQGRLDHLDIDLEGRRLFVAALGANSVEVIDLTAGRRIARLLSLHDPQGVVFMSGTRRLFVANGGHRTGSANWSVRAVHGVAVCRSAGAWQRAGGGPGLPRPIAPQGELKAPMSNDATPRLAILYPGDRTARDRANPAESRFQKVFEAFASTGVVAEPAIYHDDFRNEVLEQLLQVHGVLVWHNPIEGGRDRTQLDAMLRDVAAAGVFVSTHPDAILKLGTKDVLLAVRDLPFGTDVHRLESLAQARVELPARLALGARVLKQHRGHSGIGIWRVERLDDDRYGIRHAVRGAPEEVVPFDGVMQRIAPYFENAAHMIDQAWQARMVEGMTRAYLVQGRVAGFGHQAVVALHPPVDGGEAPATSQRLYSDADDPRFQDLRRRLEGEWLGPLCARVGLRSDALPILWDADFLLGERDVEGEEKYVLCEINVSSVSPFPDSAIAPLVEATSATLVGIRRSSVR